MMSRNWVVYSEDFDRSLLSGGSTKVSLGRKGWRNFDFATTIVYNGSLDVDSGCFASRIRRGMIRCLWISMSSVLRTSHSKFVSTNGVKISIRTDYVSSASQSCITITSFKSLIENARSCNGVFVVNLPYISY
jgi:hypothetical protein